MQISSLTAGTRESLVPGDSLPPPPGLSPPTSASILVLSPDALRYRILAARFRPLGRSGHQVQGWAQLTRIVRKRKGQHRLAILDTDLYELRATDMSLALRAIDPQLSILVLGDITKRDRRDLEKLGGILTLRAKPIRPTASLAIGRLLAQHHALEKLRNFNFEAN